jgi:RND family efflux transporter MFP subunit
MLKKILNIFNLILKRKFLVIAILIILLILFLIWKFVINRKANDVESEKIQRGKIQEVLILSGEIKADEHAELKFQTSGKLSWIGVKEGDWVNESDALAKLDITNLVSDLQRARSDLREEDATVDRVHDDVKDHDDDETFTQKETRTIAEVAKDKAWENVLKAQENLRNATLYAPFAGIITFVANPFSGVNVLFSETQIEIINPDTIFMEVSADQSEVVDIKVGQKVSIILDAYPDQEFKGDVNFISFTPESEEVGTVYKVKVDLVDDNFNVNKFKISMTGDVKFILSEKDDVLYIPIKFVNSDSEGKYVNLGQKNNRVYIETGIEGEDNIEIVGDLKEGEVVYD